MQRKPYANLQLLQLGGRLCFAPLSFVLATPAMACSADLNVGMSESPETNMCNGMITIADLNVGMSESPETNMCNGMITIVRAVGVHPKIAEPLLACCCCCLIYDVIMWIALCACFC